MDLSWSLKSDKENIARVKEPTGGHLGANMSFSGGVLTIANLNGGSGAASLPGINDESFDSDKIKLDVYEKSFQKLSNENKTLRKRVKKLTELARSKEEQLLEAFNEAVEDKRRQEDRYKQEHSAQLQSYYECFLQIEKENDALKLKVEQLKLKLAEKESLAVGKTASSSDTMQINKTMDSEAGGPDDEDKEKKRLRASQINKLSIEQMNEELNGVNRSVELYIEDKKAAAAVRTSTASLSSVSTISQQVVSAVKTDEAGRKSTSGHVEELEKRIDELEIEKEALTKKISSIESSLGRWIFRACDYKDELRQMTEKAQKLQMDYDLYREEQDISKGNSNKAFAILKQQLDDKYLDEMSHLKAENEIKLVELERSLINKYEASLKDIQVRFDGELEALKDKLEKSEVEISALDRDYNEALRRSAELEASLEKWTAKEYSVKDTQTCASDVALDLDEQGSQTPGNQQTMNKNKSESCVMSAAANVASKFGLRSIAKAPPPATGTPITTNTAVVAVSETADVMESEIRQLHKRLEQAKNEVSSLKLRIDQLVLEKKCLQCRNDELSSDLEKMSKNAPAKSASTITTRSVHSATRTIQTMTATTTVSSQTQTQQLPHSISQSSVNETIQSLRIKIEVYKAEMEALQAKSAKELYELKRSLEERCANAHAECLKLEVKLNEQSKMLDEMSRLNASLKQKLEEFEQMHSKSELKYEEELMKLQQDSSREKQVSDTIIMQQKKLLNFLQMKLGNNTNLKDGHGEPGPSSGNNHHNHLASIFKWKSSSSSNHLGANLSKPMAGSKSAGKQSTAKSSSKASSNSAVLPNSDKPSSATAATASRPTADIEAELNSNYQTYSNMKKMQSNNTLAKRNQCHQDSKAKDREANQTESENSKRQIHVFITGLNTCPTYCHVCQHLIPLIAYASKCQLCSFTCHSTCSSSAANASSNLDDPLKYCHNNYMMDSYGYTYIQKLASMPLINSAGSTGHSHNQVQSTSELNNYYRNNFLIADSLYIYVDKKWKRVWMVLRLDGNLDLYQSSTNHKPFDTINLALDKVQFETSASKIVKIVGSSASSSSDAQGAGGGGGQAADADENIYEHPDLGKFKPEISPTLIILLFGPQLCLQIGFTSFAKKNIWYDALQSSSLLAPSTIQKRSLTTLQSNNQNAAGLELARLNVNNVLKPFLELCDTIVNSYCFISEKLIALACDDGLYALNSSSSCQASNISLVKVDTIESAHKLYYHSEFSKLCFIGRKSRQFLCIDVEELLKASSESSAAPAPPRGSTSRSLETDDDDDLDLDEDETRAISVRIERIQNIDRCHLFECTMINGVWYIAVATPETIYVLLFNRHLNKFSFVKSIATTDSPCLCLKFTSKLTNQLVYGCKEFYAMDMTYLQSASILESGWNKKQDMDDIVLRGAQNVISLCIVSSANDQEALLLCFEDYGLFVTYNNNGGWSLNQAASKSKQVSSSSNMLPSLPSSASSGALAASNAAAGSTTSHILKWPRGGGVPPLQVEYDSPFLYLFYNDSIVVYNISFNASPGDLDSQFAALSSSYLPVVKRVGISFVYKPRYLGTLHTRDANCLIISNRRPLDQSLSSPASSQFSEINKYQQNGAITEEEDDSDVKSCSTKVPNSATMQEFTDKICLSYFDTLAN